MGVPKRKTSKMRLRTRKAANRWHAGQLQSCAQCGSRIPGHVACKSCGYYRGRQVLTIEAV
jgi:large subunit ribosomal protein L32